MTPPPLFLQAARFFAISLPEHLSSADEGNKSVIMSAVGRYRHSRLMGFMSTVAE